MAVSPAAVAALLAVGGPALGGAAVRALHREDADAWAALLRALLPAGAPARRLPRAVTDDRLVGGLDLAATLAAGRPVAEPGLLALAHGGLVVVPGAERAERWVTSRLAGAMDDGEVSLERHGVRERLAARIIVVALDDTDPRDDDGAEPGLPAVLADRLAVHVAIPPGWAATPEAAPDERMQRHVERARLELAAVDVSPAHVSALVGCAVALGVASLRAALLAVRVARASAALDGRTTVSEADVALAAELALAPRATALPAAAVDAPDDAAEAPNDGADAPPRPPPREPAADERSGSDRQAADDVAALHDVVLRAARAAIPPGLLARLDGSTPRTRATAESGRSTALQASAARGRQVGTRQGTPRGGARLDLLETLRAAAPWQRLRAEPPTARAPRVLVQVRRDDFRVRRLVERRGTTTIFAVDASGSAALHRLAETKGAVELMLAESYARRDRVSVVAFRGAGAHVLLPPTRALARAKRALGALAGGGGTPLAAGIDAACGLALAARREGSRAVVVFLTDARANVARDGGGGRARAEADAVDAARRLRASGCAALLVDTSPRGEPFARRLALELGGRYEPLPYPESHAVSGLARALAAAPTGERRG